MSESAQKSTTLKFAADCTIYEAAEHYKKIMDAINHASVVELDLSDIENVDSSFIQLLVAIQMEARRNKARLEISAGSDVVSDYAACIYCQDLSASAGKGAESGDTDNVA